MISYPTLRDWKFPFVRHAYTVEDTMRYALALGYGEDPTDPAQLRFVNDVARGTPVALPTMAVTLGFPGSWMADPATGIDFARIVHGEESLVMHRPLPAEGCVIAEHRVTRIVDKGPGRGALIAYAKELRDEASGALLATVEHTTFARGDGGFASAPHESDRPAPIPAAIPARAPDHVVDIPTLPQLALMYRLCADRNPLHSDPEFARAAGFERPILHGLCSYGLALRALLASGIESDPARLRSLSVRFTAPVFPGETIRFEFFCDGSAVHFRARVAARDTVVLDYGHIELAMVPT